MFVVSLLGCLILLVFTDLLSFVGCFHCYFVCFVFDLLF